MKITSCRILGVLMVCGFVMGQQQPSASGGDEAALRVIEEKWSANVMNGDTAALSSIWADAFISTSTEGKVRTKAEMLVLLTSGEMKFQTSKVDDIRVFVYGTLPW
jgi:hypothetical protein